MTLWMLLRRHVDSPAWCDTGRTCLASEWRSAVWQLLANDLVGHTVALDLIDNLNGHSQMTLRINSGTYRVAVVREVDGAELADLQMLVSAEADEILRALMDEGENP